MIVLDTNVLSETFKPSPSKAVLRWLAAQEPPEVFTTTITQAELLYGIELLRAGKRRGRLSTAINDVFAEEFHGRILPFDEEAARVFPKIVANWNAVARPIAQLDTMIAAIAHSRRAALATRNTRDCERCGVRIINPWTE